jgi:enoyl-CoA hydratase/carnithine racemase
MGSVDETWTALMSDRVLVSFENRIAQVLLNRAGKHNALDLDMFKGIAAAQKQVTGTRDIRAVILAGAGVDFCSGLDIKSVMRNRGAAVRLMWKWLPWRANLAQVVSTGWRDLSVPVIAAIHGRCWGGGMQIALGADFRIAHPDASLSVMEGKWGLIPDMGGTLAMRDIMYRDQAMKLAMTAEEVNARQALDAGLVTQISTNPAGAAMELALQLAKRSPDAVAAVKRLYRKSWHGRGLVLARESAYQLRILAGANRGIAVRRQRGDAVDFRPAGRW